MPNMMNYIKSSAANLDLHEILQAPTKVLLGVTDDAAQALLDHLGIETIFDLAMSRVFSNAHDLLLAGLDPTNTLYKFGTPPADIINESLVENVKIDELRFESIGILEGITPASATSLGNALDVTTVRDLALYPPYVAARDIFVSVFYPQTLPTFDKDAPSDLVPQSGQYPTERVFYKTLVIDELEEDIAQLIKLDTAGPVDISPLTNQKFGFKKPAIGALLTYSQSWFAQGVALGQLLHSLALAPGESTRMAMIDWSRRIKGKQQEDITETEELSNTTQHNRAISEVTNAVASESQSGFSRTHAESASFQKGSAAGVGLGPITLGGSSGSGKNMTDAMSFSSSSGRRDLSATMAQNVMDSTQQNANAVRNRRASVIKEVSQEEHEKVSTRIVTNYNHMHAMSVQYYEVIQIYRVVVQLSEVEKCLFIPMQLINFDNIGLVRKFREVLLQAALSQDAAEMLTNNYDTVDVKSLEDGYISLKNGGIVPHDMKENAKVVGLPNETRLTGFYLMPAGVDPALRIVIYLRDGSTITPARSGQDVKLSDACLIHEIDFIGMTNPTPSAVFSFLAAVNFSFKGIPFSFDVPIKLEANSATQKILIFTGGGIRSKLIDHLKANQLHYSQAIFNALDPATVTLLLSAYSYNNKPVTVQIDPQPITTAGNYLVFKMHVEPDTDGQFQEERDWAKWMNEHGIDFNKIKQEIVPLPSGGVFAEAVLGRYNSAEKLDMTRFWNWQDSPIPFSAPEIAPIQTGSRGTAEDLKPGNLSQPLVNIVSPTSLPDPTGMTAVLQSIANGNMFRDMSGLANTIGLAQAALASSGQGAGEAAAQAGSNLAVAAKKEVEMFKAALAFVASMYGKGSPDTSPSTISNEGAKINHGRNLDQRNPGQSLNNSNNSSPLSGSASGGGSTGGEPDNSSNIPGLTNTSGPGSQEQAAFQKAVWGQAGDSQANTTKSLLAFSPDAGTVDAAVGFTGVQKELPAVPAPSSIAFLPVNNMPGPSQHPALPASCPANEFFGDPPTRNQTTKGTTLPPSEISKRKGEIIAAINAAKADRPLSADNLQHWLDGTGTVLVMSASHFKKVDSEVPTFIHNKAIEKFEAGCLARLKDKNHPQGTLLPPNKVVGAKGPVRFLQYRDGVKPSATATSLSKDLFTALGSFNVHSVIWVQATYKGTSGGVVGLFADDNYEVEILRWCVQIYDVYDWNLTAATPFLLTDSQLKTVPLPAGAVTVQKIGVDSNMVMIKDSYFRDLEVSGIGRAFLVRSESFEAPSTAMNKFNLKV